MTILLVASVLALISAVTASNVVFCYYGTWSNWRPGKGKFTPANINPNLCTHLGYTFFGTTPEGKITSLDSYLDFKENWGLGYVQDVIALKKINPNLKVFAVVGGWNEGSAKYSAVAANPTLRKNFVESSLAFVQKYGFDGLDLDWEYPAQRGGVTSDKANFVTLLKELNVAYKKNNLLLTIAVGATENQASPSYDIPAISKYLDLINLMTYDLYGAWDRTTGHNSPLYNSGINSVEKAVNYWLSQGAPANKLTVGLPFYGRSFTLINSANNGIGAPASGPGTAGQFTREAGFLGYNEICSDHSWNVVYADELRAPYATKGNQWVGYDDVDSIGEKVNYAMSKKLAGVMIWSIETDDFHGDCGAGKYPLLNKIYPTINGGVVSAPATKPSTINPPTVGGGDTCEGKSNGFYRASSDCSAFYQCVGGRKYYDYNCPKGLVFNTVVNICDYPYNVQC